MTIATCLEQTWTRFFASSAYEQDLGFRNEMLHLCRKGMFLAGVLGILAVFANLGAYATAGRALRWVYGDPATTVALWDKLVVFVMSVVFLVLARTRTGPRWGRLVGGGILLAVGLAMLVDDFYQGGDFYSDRYLSVTMLVLFAVIPYRPAQALSFAFIVWSLYVLGYLFLPGLLGGEAAVLEPGLFIYMLIVLFICVGMCMLLYNGRYEQYLARRKVEQLKEHLEKAHTSLAASLQLLTETQDRLIHTEKMVSLGRFAAGLAHEMRNPLNFVNNFSQLSVELADELAQALESYRGAPVVREPDEVKELLAELKTNAAKINEHGKRAESIVRSMVRHVSNPSSERQATDLNALLDQALTLSQCEGRATYPDVSITVEKDYDVAVGHVEVVARQIGTVFLNLLSNALYAVNEEALSLSGRYVPTIRLSTRRHGDRVVICISDNGPGIPGNLFTKVFEPFFTTKPTGAGTGLGLSLSYEIVVQGHQGEIAVESKAGEGATFIVTLPAQGSS